MSIRGKVVLAALTLLVLFGCSRQQGPQRYSLSGTVRYKGQLVPDGTMSFLPDDTKGNDGPGVAVLIHGGTYQTEPHEGVIGGPHNIRISGWENHKDEHGEITGKP